MAGSYTLLAVEVLSKLVIVPYLLMSGGVVIANQLGFAATQNLQLFLAVASMTGVPWVLRATLGLVANVMLAQAETEVLMQKYAALQELNRMAQRNDHGDDQTPPTSIH